MENEPIILEADRRLSQSLIWKIQRDYFLNNGMKAWQDDVVPHYISCNPYMARAYGQVIFGFLRDCEDAVRKGEFLFDPHEPIYIVELGAGTGRLGNHFLHQFFPRLKKSRFADLQFKYILTDFVPEIVTFWHQHGKLKPWVEAGVLDMGLFDIMDPRPLHLIHSQQTLAPEAVKNPIILFANYFFDTIPQDCFKQQEGQLCENLLTVKSDRQDPDLSAPNILQQFELSYEAIPLSPPYYENPLYDEILADYENSLPDTTFTFPNVGLDGIRFWQQYGRGRLLLLSSDKGYAQAESLIDETAEKIKHHGSFSLMVNFHAMSQYVLKSGGTVLHPSHYQDNIQIMGFLLGEMPSAGRETGQAFAEAISSGGPDDFFAMEKMLSRDYDFFSLPQLLSFLRFSGWDGMIFQDCFAALLAQVIRAEPIWYPDVRDALMAIWQQHLPLNEEDELRSKVVHLLGQMGFEPEKVLAEHR